MTRLRIMTWNVLYQEKADNILALIKQANPDILCCQEITANSYINPGRDLPNEISQLMSGEYRYFEVLQSLDGHPASMGNAIISKFPITQHHETLIVKGEHDISAGRQSRGYLEVKLGIDGKELAVGTTHLSFIPYFKVTATRRKEVDKLLLAIKDHKKNFILTGDLNSSPDTYTIKQFGEII